MDTTLNALAKLLAAEGLLAKSTSLTQEQAEIVVTGADCDSRFSAPHHIFVCKGASFKPAYLESAVASGAVAYLCDEARSVELAAVAPGVPALVASNLRRAMALVSAMAWNHPDRSLQMVGLTGTKGKSTTAYMLKAILDAEKPNSTGIIGSIETYDGIERAESINTTPESPDLWRHLANTRDSGLTRMVMEVSSQALKYDRVLGLGFDVACFLNIGEDHISPVEHPNFNDYFESKLRIFDQARVAVVNLDMDHAQTVLVRAATCERVLTVSSRDGSADIWCSKMTPTEGGIRFCVRTPSWEGEVALSMVGAFNVDNALAAIAVCEVLGIGREQITAGLAHVRVPGRMELIATKRPHVFGIVDFAHNQMAFSRFYPSVSAQFAGAYIISVFGAVGVKATERRVQLPQEAAKWSDLMIFTTDDPATEPVEEICAQMVEATPAGVSTEVIIDRRAAVERAVEDARTVIDEDGSRTVVICLMCRGTESTQHIGNEFVPSPLDSELFEEAADKLL